MSQQLEYCNGSYVTGKYSVSKARLGLCTTELCHIVLDKESKRRHKGFIGDIVAFSFMLFVLLFEIMHCPLVINNHHSVRFSVC